MANQKEFLTSFFYFLNEDKINYCVLRNYQSLPESLNGSDLDILVSTKDIERFYVSLRKTLLKNNGHIITEYGERTPRICVLGNSINGHYGLQIDVHEGMLPYKVTNMFPVNFLLKRTKEHNKIKIADDKDADFLAFLKEIFNNKTCEEKYFKNAQIAWFENKEIYNKELITIYNKSFLIKLDFLLNKNFSKKNIHSFSYIGSRILKNGFKTKIKIYKAMFNKFYRFIKPPGFTIAILGTDGSGKTTVFNEIRKPLNDAVHNSLYYEHMRPNLTPNIAQLFGANKHEKLTINPHGSKPSGILGSLFRLFYYSFDYIFGYWIKIYPVKVKKSCIWIFDRYYYDYLIDQKRARINLPVWIIKAVEFLIPKPDLILCLGTDPNIINDRKPELPIKEVVYQVEKLKSFCDSENRAVWIDTGGSINLTVQNTLDTIINKMASKYK